MTKVMTMTNHQEETIHQNRQKETNLQKSTLLILRKILNALLMILAI